MWASRAIILFGLFFALILNLCPLFTWASRAILNSYACFFSSLKPPFTFAPPTVRLVVAPPCLPFCFIHLRIHRSITPAVPLGLVYFACCIYYCLEFILGFYYRCFVAFRA